MSKSVSHGGTSEGHTQVRYPGVTYWGHCLIFSIFAVVWLIMHTAIIRLLRGRSRRSNEPLLALESWRRKFPIIEGSINFITILLIVVPTVLFVVCLVLAKILSEFEDWPYHMAFDYLLCHVVNIGSIHPLTPTTVAGRGVDIVLSGLLLILGSLVIGVCGSMQIVGYTQERVPGTWFGCTISIVAILLFIWFLTFLTALVLAPIESISVGTAYLYMISLLCGISTPLTDFKLASNTGFFFASLCSIVELGASGAVIGIVSGHAKISSLLAWFEGDDKTSGADTSPPIEVEANVRPGVAIQCSITEY